MSVLSIEYKKSPLELFFYSFGNKLGDAEFMKPIENIYCSSWMDYASLK